VTGLTITTQYKFRYRARNLYGWSSDYSDETVVNTIAVPSNVNVSTTTSSVVGTNLVIDWDEPTTNGSPILAYEV
jgi:hypothetical protein